MTDLQQVEFKLLQAVDIVCKQLNIKYYLICGSALGAVKYSGFIPWDDDLDIGLLRPDYEIFVEKAQELLPNSYFLQNYRTDPAFPQIFSKVRDSNTTDGSVRIPAAMQLVYQVILWIGAPARDSQAYTAHYEKI